jgi:hypothetical protein
MSPLAAWFASQCVFPGRGDPTSPRETRSYQKTAGYVGASSCRTRPPGTTSRLGKNRWGMRNQCWAESVLLAS